MAEPDLHALPHETFLEHVHSFEFWFGAVRGYLEGREFGRHPETPAESLPDAEREQLVTVLCNYCVGETAALEGAGGLIRIAPNRATKVFLATQTVDEGRHLEAFLHRLGELGIANPEAEIQVRALPELRVFKQRLAELVDTGDWEAALFAQNVILESMEFASFHHHARRADGVTREILLGVIKDERRHIGFGENELGRRLKRDPGLGRRLHAVREELDRQVLASFDHTLRALGSTASERDELSREYLQAVERLGFA